MRRSIIRPIGLCLMTVLVIVLVAARAQEPQPPNQTEIDREKAINAVRAINAAEYDYRTDHGHFGSWHEVSVFGRLAPGPPEMTPARIILAGTEVIPGYRLTLLVADDGATYSVSLHDMKTHGCGLSFFSDQSGLIYQGTIIDCCPSSKTSRTRRISNLQDGTIERVAIGSSHGLMAPSPLRMDSQCARLA
jgi:hypothetical protein